jgi:inorganic pyrophosphatase
MASKSFYKSFYDYIPPTDINTGLLNVVIETPRGSRCKNKFDSTLKVFKLSKPLPIGMHFPYDFGSVPGTLAEDGDCLDVMVISEHATFPGCLLPVRLIGVLEARQTERKGKIIRNDRLIGTVEFDATESPTKTCKEMSKKLLYEIENFFISYNRLEGKKFEPLGWYGPKRAGALLQKQIIKKKN